MSFKGKYNINPEFSSLFEFESKKDEFKHNAKILMFRFIKSLENINGNKDEISNKVLANALDTSRSFVTQLLRGDKIINLVSLAKLQKEFNVIFEVRAIPLDKTSVSVNAKTSNYTPTEWEYEIVTTNPFDAIPGGLSTGETQKKQA